MPAECAARGAAGATGRPRDLHAWAPISARRAATHAASKTATGGGGAGACGGGRDGRRRGRPRGRHALPRPRGWRPRRGGGHGRTGPHGGRGRRGRPRPSNGMIQVESSAIPSGRHRAVRCGRWQPDLQRWRPGRGGAAEADSRAAGGRRSVPDQARPPAPAPRRPWCRQPVPAEGGREASRRGQRATPRSPTVGTPPPD